MSDFDKPTSPRSGAEDSPTFVEENDSFRLLLTLQNNQIECLAEIKLFPPEKPAEELPYKVTYKDNVVDEPLQPAAVLAPPDLLRLLQKHGIARTIDYSAVYEFCAALDLGMTPEPKILARGVDSVPGGDGWFELLVKTSGEAVCFEEDDQGNVDLRKRHAYSEIEPGQKLGLIHPPQEGIAGVDVLGLPVPATAGEPFVLTAGEGVVLKYEDRVAFATRPGRALFEKGKVSVVDLLVVPGDVDLDTGDIDFHGFVEIKGDVPDDFDVKATKGIKVSGTIGACQIESGGSIEISSMAGKEVGKIVCHGDLYAGYLNQVTVHCFGHVYVKNEIRNSTIKATGQVSVERGAIIGGRCIAMDGIETKDLGTRSGLKTYAVAGVYFPDADRFDYLRKQLQQIDQQIKSICNALGPLQASLKHDNKNAVTAETRLAILNEQLDKLYEEKNNFTAEIKVSKPQSLSSMNPKINVRGDLKEGVVLTLGQTTEEIKNGRRGGLSIIENSRDGGLRFLSLTPLPVKAVQLEEEILAAAEDTALDKNNFLEQ